MVVIKLLFWCSVIILLYTHIGYPLLLIVISQFIRSKKKQDSKYLPFVTMIISAHNEESVIEEKIRNCLALDYPKEKLEIIVVSDASSDRTDEIVKKFQKDGIKLLRIEPRQGKTYGQNEAIKIANGEVILFSDANSIYESDAILKLVRNFSDEKIGCVMGCPKYKLGSDSVEAELLYWKYDQFIKRLEGQISSPVGGDGSIYAVRKDLVDSIQADFIDDFIRPLRVVQKGYRMAYEPKAVAWESTTESETKEFRRRSRIVMRSFYSFLKDITLHELLLPWRHGFFSLQLISHKFLRWLSAFFMGVAFITNLILMNQNFLYHILLFLQILFYTLVIIAIIYRSCSSDKLPKFLHIPYFFCVSSYEMLKGAILALSGKTVVTWEPIRKRSNKADG